MQEKDFTDKRKGNYLRRGENLRTGFHYNLFKTFGGLTFGSIYHPVCIL